MSTSPPSRNNTNTTKNTSGIALSLSNLLPTQPSTSNNDDTTKLPTPSSPSSRIVGFRKFAYFYAIILCSVVISVFLFTSGFLLTRQSLQNSATCPLSPSLPASSSPDSNQSKYTTPCNHIHQPTPRFKKAIVLIIDALRYDFTHYDIQENNSTTTNSPYYINKLPILHNLLKTRPSNALRFQFKADPPTTTLQRLKALTTGTLPTFIDAGNNFASTAILEDNWIRHAKRAGKKIMFMGDDTWMGLYPNTFDQAYPYPSLNVWDLHTVDNGVLHHLYPFLAKQNQSSWDILVGHFLGVDHAGHRYGPNHPEMGAKLTQMNGILTRVFNEIDDETLVVVMGDHGMDHKGDHGGDSEMELNAALFLYSKSKPLTTTSSSSSHSNDFLNSLLPELTRIEDKHGFKRSREIHRTITQIDLVPTLCLLLDIPIPFENVGTVIPEVFLSSRDNNELLTSIRTNAKQVFTYLNEYFRQQKGNDLSSDAFGNLIGLYESAELAYDAFIKDQSKAEQAIIAYYTFTRATLSTCKSIWAQFDNVLQILGCLLLILTCFTVWIVYRFVICRGVLEDLHGVFGGFVSVNVGIVNVVGLIVTVSFGLAWSSVLRHGIIRALENTFNEGHEWTSMGLYHEWGFWFVLIMNVFYCFGVGIYTKSRRIAVPLITSTSSWDPLTWVFMVCVIGYLFIFGSDSFIIHEDSLIASILTGFGIMSLWTSLSLLFSNQVRTTGMALRSKTSSPKSTLVRIAILSFLFTVIIRITSIVTICRDEQIPYCVPFFYSSPTSSVSSLFTLLNSVGVCVGVWLVLIWVLKREDIGDAYYGVGKLLVAYVWIFAQASVCLYWVLDSYSVDNENNVIKMVKLGIPKLVYAGVVGVWGVVWYGRPCSTALRIVPSDSETKETKIVCMIVGLANNLGGGALIFTLGLALLVSCFLKPMGLIVLQLGIICVLTVVELRVLWNQYSSTSMMTRFGSVFTHKPWVWSILIYWVSMHIFFRTGHQATLQSIDWSIGFVGIEEVNFFWSPVLICLNFFGPFWVICGMGVGLLITWKRPFVNMPVVSGNGLPTSLPNTSTSQQYQPKTQYEHMVQTLYTTILFFTWFCAVLLGMSMVTCWVLQRHLMVWKVFAPRLLLGVGLVVGGLVVAGGVVVGFAVRRVLVGFEEFCERVRKIQ